MCLSTQGKGAKARRGIQARGHSVETGHHYHVMCIMYLQTGHVLKFISLNLFGDGLFPSLPSTWGFASSWGRVSSDSAAILVELVAPVARPNFTGPRRAFLGDLEVKLNHS